MQKFQSKNLKVGDHLEDLGVDGITILKWAMKKRGVAHDGVQLQAFVNSAINHKIQEISGLAEQLLDSQDGLYCTS
jgi:hypothetical protein